MNAPIPMDTARAFALLASILFAAIGVAGFWRSRPARTGPVVALAGVGPFSHVTFGVIGLASLGVAYHIFVYAFGFAQFRAPLWLAFSAATIAVLLSIAIDAMENRSDRKRGAG